MIIQKMSEILHVSPLAVYAATCAAMVAAFLVMSILNNAKVPPQFQAAPNE